MAKQTDQTPETEDQPTAEQIAEQKALDASDTKADEAAAKVSEDFDALIDDSEDVEETPSDEDDEQQKADDEKPDDDVEETPSDDDDEIESKPDADGISDELRKQATDLGMIPEEIAEFKDDADIARSIKILSGIRDEDGEQEEPAPKPAKTVADKAGDAKKPADPSELVIENEAEIDPGIVKIMKDQYKKSLALEALLAEQGVSIAAEIDRLKAEREKVAMARFDEKIEALGKDFHDTFGKGNTLEMSTRSTARKNRNRLGLHIVSLGKAMIESGEEVTADHLFEMALRNVFNDKVNSVDGGKLHKKTSARSRQRLGRASTKKTGKQTKQQSAVQASEAFDELIDASEDA